MLDKTSEKLRNRMNNHRYSLTNLYWYHHFNPNGYSEEDLSIIPIEKITTIYSDKGIHELNGWIDKTTAVRELCTFYPYAL